MRVSFISLALLALVLVACRNERPPEIAIVVRKQSKATSREQAPET